MLKRIITHELFAPCLLIFMAILALVLKNSSLNGFYELITNYKAGVIFGDLNLIKPLTLWVNDGLMAIFFFWVGLEVKKEILIGELSNFKAASLPLIAALGGVIVPALIYSFININDSFALQGFAIPTATDIAFALGVLLLLGNRIPKSLTVFLLSLAIFDDIAAIIIIALFYTNDLSVLSLSLATCGLAVLLVLNYLHISLKSLYVIVGIFIWVCVLKSGVHATLAGMACAFFIPLKTKDNKEFLEHIMHDLTPFINYLILPLFALFNAGVLVSGLSLNDFNAVFFGVFLGLFVGKQLGVFSFVLIASKFGFKLPSNKLQLYGVCILTGIGFTMSFFINTLVFENTPELFNSAKLAILSASFISAVLGYIWLRFISK